MSYIKADLTTGSILSTSVASPQSLKISIFVCKLDGGGAERAMVNLTKGLIEQGVAVDLLLGKDGGNAYLDSIDPRVQIVRLNYKRTLFSIPSIVKYLKAEQPAAIISAADYTNIAITIAKRLSAVPSKVMICEQNTPSYFRGSYTIDRQLIRRLNPILIRLFYPLADQIIAVSQGVAADLAKISGISESRIQVVHNPIVTPDILQKSNSPVEHEWFTPGSPPVILGIGRLSLQKDFATLIKAFGLVQKQRPANLLILGEGEQRSTLEALIQKLGVESSVQLAGFVDNPFAYLKKAEVFVLSSESEGLPSVLIEALSVGTSVVSTDCPCGPSEILEQGRYGKLVPVGDVNALAQSILSVLSTPSKPEHMIERAEQYSLKNVTDSYLNLALK